MNSVTRRFALTVAVSSTLLAASSRAAGPIHVNPQPLPPIHSDSRARADNPTIKVNPQPLPPVHPDGRLGSAAKAPVNVNPQPLPPRS